MNHPSSPLSQTWETYTASWQASTAAEKQAMFAQSLDPQCEYTDPMVTAHGWQELLAYMEAFQEQIPGGHFQTRTFSHHHQQSMTTWNMLDGKGQVIGEGTSYGKYNDQGKLVAMTGFFTAA